MSQDYWMNTADMRDKANLIRASRQELESKLQSITAQASSTVGSAWIAPGALTFENEFQSWVNQLKVRLDELDYLANQINAEADEYDRVASALA